jgi:uncharacterized repeat protein (TIGR02543 family)
MEKIRLRVFFALVLCVFSCFFVFAQDDDEDKENSSPSSAVEVGNGNTGGGKTSQQVKTPQPAKYTVTFDADGGNVSPSSKKVEGGKTVEKLPELQEKEGQRFEGWFTEKDGGGTEFKADTPVKEDITVYAKWIVTYTVTFDAGDGDIIYTETVENGKTVKTRPADPKEEGHLFGGWFTEKDGGGTEFKADTPIKKDITVYAKWKSIGDIIDGMSNELSDLKNDIDRVKKDVFNDLVLLLVITGVFALLLAVFIALNIILLFTTRKKIRRLEEKTDAVEKKYADVEQEFARYDSIIEDQSRRFLDIENSSPGSPGETAAELKKEIVNIQSRIQGIEKNVRILSEQKIITRGITSGSLSVMDAFNLWAENPSNPLPPEVFYYIEGEMKIRVKREIKESAAETKWITNRKGTKKYLFPNPNSFNQMTDIHELYKMDQAKLRGRGQNKIKIIIPCEMTKDGFIEFPGELELL